MAAEVIPIGRWGKTAKKRAAKAELKRRAWRELRQRDPEAFRARVAADIRTGFGDKQGEVDDSLQKGLRYVALCCSRRAGKTNFLAKLIVLALLDAQHNEAVFFVADTLQRGKGLIWKEVEKLVDRYQLPWKLKENEGQIHTPAGAALFLLGLNQQRQATKSARGFKAVLYLLDEAQDQDHLLKPLLAAVSPALSDRRGAFIVAGTPGWAEAGTWYEWVHGLAGGFKSIGWTVRENEKFPLDRYGGDVEVMLAEQRKAAGWDENHPDYLREWLNIWAVDPTQLVCEYVGSRNGIAALPKSYGRHWRHVIGIDYGWDDAAAWVVVAANPYGPERVVVHAEAHAKLDNDEAAAVTTRLVKQFETTNVVCDPAGGGKTFFETFNRRYGQKLKCQIRAANKLGKADSVKWINTDLRKGRLVVLLPAAEALAKEIRQLRWKDKEAGEVLTSSVVRDDCFDAFRYAMVEIAPWVEREHTKKDQKRDEERLKKLDEARRERAVEELEREARNKAQREATKKKAAGGYSWRR